MYTYSIYWIKEEVANHYFHKSGVLYRFLKDYQMNSDRKDLAMQFNYITYPFSYSEIINHLTNYRHLRILEQNEEKGLKIYSRDAFISLHINENQLKFRCKSLQDAEELLFPVLRQMQRLLFVIGDNIQNFGWLAPILTHSKNQEEQVLYSFL
ncbi:MAG: sporulation inhibitor of replication protein SirA [Bacillota bacterium]|uniref:Sporulation inhibitor of replication protein SirA n=1 Tax=Virgibacillus salarius TaxID=447199 RepID=A0A941DZG3_9BACI|nr:MULTISPECIES: sporulation inhibitor of replication protein SirA [Bacillaceae]NAZ08886.1 sporulation inhibitor of replication protein SirA [Agaribacter marinus]MBR7796178.1 sporulation inhibitor of replication protein SirA [Virgibacillus salarius]MCC2249691.1 sporulation inhibitor of replication protein SirA [Virgibacillus sp. AGTR]MDY7042682.1 sporulation inhibitor of replication protein SirA [Virgibacillus sp. M23]QRZ17136.1 sporulation inhibitor of replication protein SirA [Virgibacillus 